MIRFRMIGLLLLLPALIAVGCTDSPDYGVTDPVGTAGPAPADINTVSFDITGMT